MTSSRLLSPVRTLAHRIAARPGAAVTIGLGSATLVIGGTVLHASGVGHVFPGRLAAEATASVIADVVLTAPDTAKPLLPTGIVLAADPAPGPAPLGPPTLLFTAPLPGAPPKPARNVAAAMPANRPGTAAARSAPAKPLIPPAPLPAKLSPPPEARSALPIDTELQPLASPAPAPPAGGPPAAGKPPAG